MDDIKYVLNPTFTSEQIGSMDSSDKLSRAIDGTMYLPGIVGLNNIKANDYCNVILQVSFSLYLFLFFLLPQRCIFTHTKCLMAVTWLRWLVASHSLQRLIFIPRLVYGGGQSGTGTGFSLSTLVSPVIIILSVLHTH